ncbi:MAG: crossover junction endodeoxyribonuclease RuvC [Verrucomicrobia bacterium]|nr:crossover junction endodeoxyribonuclease RuvC [Verrucomicrobiota bacterium]
MGKKIILGIDPGTRITGYGVIESLGSSLIPLDFGAIRPPATAPIEERYQILFQGVEKLIERFSPDAVAVETPFVYKNAQSALKLGGALAVILLAPTLRNIPVYKYAPKKAKLALVGKGGASKEQVQKMVQLLLRLPSLPEPEDAADALALAVCHANGIGFQTKVELCTNISKGR